MASHVPMDADGMAETCIAACLAWTDGHQQEVEDIGFQVLEADESSLTFRADGKLFQLILPSGLFHGGCSEGENFVAMNMGSSAEDSLMTVLNEKLERVRVHPLALSEVFDLFVRVLTGRRSRPASGKGNGRTLDVGSTAHAQPMVGVEGNNRSDSESEDELDSDEEVDDYDHDDVLADDFNDRLLELDGRVSRKRPVERSQGYVYFLAEAARERCEAARANAGPNLQLGLRQASSANVDEIVKYCRVSPLPQLGGVQLHLELQALINDRKIASALGLSFDFSLDVLLEFDQYFWEARCSKPLEAARVVARQGSLSKTPQNAEGAYQKADSKAEEFETLYRKCFGNQEKVTGYGLSSLIPELVRVFFSYRARKVNAGLRAMAWKNQQLDALLDQCAAMENPFIGLLYLVGGQLRELPAWCAVCWSALPASICRLRTCPNELCLYEFEELGLGSAILQEVQESPKVVEFELTLACAAAGTTRDVFEPFPGFMLENNEVRGRSGWFSNAGPSTTNPQTNAAPTAKRKTAAAQGVDNKNLKVLLSTLQTIPSVDQLKQCAGENALRKMLAMAGYTGSQKTGKELSLSYDLFRFILSTNRLSLRLLGDSHKISGIQSTTFQFAVIHDSPEREAAFERHSKMKGSFFAFHGSGLVNWYSILRNGLRSMSSTLYQSSGAAYGPGIYLANNFALSYGYCRGGADNGWKNSTIEDGCTVVAICEVVEGSCPAANTCGIYVVPPDKEDNVIIRYLLINPPDYHRTTDAVISGTVLSPQAPGSSHRYQSVALLGASVVDPPDPAGPAAQPVDLRQHFRNLKAADKILQDVQLNNQRAKALARIEELHAKAIVESQSLPVAGIGGEGSSGKTAAFSKLTTGEEFASKPHDFGYGRKRWKNEGTPPAPVATATPAATQAITKEYRSIQQEISKATLGRTAGLNHTNSFLTSISVDIPDETNLYTWHVRLFHNLFKSSCALYKDLVDWAKLKKEETPHILLEVTFCGRYPFQPPFIRVVYPMFEFHTGHVTVGGSICMELLTESGWSPAFSFESVLVQIVNALIEGEGRIDKRKGVQEYSEREALEAFNRVASTHGWKVSQRD